MLQVICNIIKNFNSTEEKFYDKLAHTGEEPYIYDFIIVSLINKPGSQEYPLSNILVKIKQLVKKILGPKGIANLMLKSSLISLFCKTDADFHQKATFIL